MKTRLNVGKLLKMEPTSPSLQDSTTKVWLEQLRRHYPHVKKACRETGKVVPFLSTNSITRVSKNKFKFSAESDGGTTVLLGPPEVKEESVYDYRLEEDLYFVDDGDGDGDGDDGEGQSKMTQKQKYLRREKDSISIVRLAELMTKLTPKAEKVVWGEDVMEDVLRKSQELNLLLSAYEPWSEIWINSLCDDNNGDGEYIDTFRHLFPNAKYRFTCFNQLENKRYTNEGSRIDFILVDKAMEKNIVVNESRHLDVGKKSTDDIDEFGEVAAWHAATFSDEYKAVGFQGGGLVNDYTDRAVNSLFGEQECMLNTLPCLSDHIAISVILSGLEEGVAGGLGSLKLEKGNKKTREAQPHKAQMKLASFFGGGGGGGGRSSSSSSSFKSSVVPMQQNKKKSTKSVSNFFGAGGGGGAKKKQKKKKE